MRLLLSVPGLALVLTVASTPQIPERFTNLQILSKDITRPALVGVMPEQMSYSGMNFDIVSGVLASPTPYEPRTAAVTVLSACGSVGGAASVGREPADRCGARFIRGGGAEGGG